MTIQQSQKNKSKETQKLLQEEKKDLFQWTKHWYPMAIADYLDPTRPHAMQLLGKELVLWRNKSGKWCCFEDSCPHRLAPLSEGRISKDGALMCAYHAWSFNSEGKCVRIPQSKDKETEAKNCLNSKSCATAYPVKETQNIIWVWPESGTKANLESKTKEPLTIPELENDPEKVVVVSKYVRDLQYGWDFVMENLSDPAHFPVSHHDAPGLLSKNPEYFNMIPSRKISTDQGFSFNMSPLPDYIKENILDFQPPCKMTVTTVFQDGTKSLTALYTSPSRPGLCRHIPIFILIKNDRGKVPKGLELPAKFPLPNWLNHILLSRIFHQDLVFLHYQEQKLIKRGRDKWQEAFYLPNPQDKMVITFRKWLEKRAGGSVGWLSESSSQLLLQTQDRDQLFDVWKTHTQNCTVCQDALKRINYISLLTYIGAIVLLCLGIMIDVRVILAQTTLATTEQITKPVANLILAPHALFWCAVGGSIFLALTSYLLKKVSRLFYVYKFNHADHHWKI